MELAHCSPALFRGICGEVVRRDGSCNSSESLRIQRVLSTEYTFEVQNLHWFFRGAPD